MHTRHLLTPLAALLAVVAACADPTTAPVGANPSSALTPRGPQLSMMLGSTFLDSLDFPEAKWIPGVYSVSTSTCGPDSGTPWACVPPKPWSPTDFDVAIHLRDRSTWDTPESFRAMHGAMCQPYSNDPNIGASTDDFSHLASTYTDLNYRCRNHMMTALKASGYGAIFVTPNAMVDFSSGEATIRWAMSTMRGSGQDWVDLWITPWEDNLKLPLDASLTGTDLQGPPRRAVHVRMTSGNRYSTAFKVFVVDNFVETPVAQTNAAGYEGVIGGQSSTRRDTFELKISKTHVKIGMWKGENPIVHAGAVPFAGITWVDQPISLPWGTGVVQFGHHSMNPASDGGFGGTWHWDDFTIAPALPFTIINTSNAEGASLPNPRYADSKHPDMVFRSAMPATGERYVRFSAYGEKVRLAFTDGKWIDALPQAAAQDVDGRFRSYFVRVPTEVGSATGVTFKAKKDKTATESTNEDGGEWRVRDVSVWVR